MLQHYNNFNKIPTIIGINMTRDWNGLNFFILKILNLNLWKRKNYVESDAILIIKF